MFSYALHRFYIQLLLSLVIFTSALFIIGFPFWTSLIVSFCFIAMSEILFSPEMKKDYQMMDNLIKHDKELSMANEKLRQLDEIKSNFISIAAHQLRTPLSGIKWTLNMLLAGDMGDLNNDQKTFIMKTNESNNRMITLVNDMLDVDRIQSDKVHFGFRNMNIMDLLDNVLFEMNSQARDKNISIEFKNKIQNLPEVYIDPDSMRSAIQNIVDNAIKYTATNGKIIIDIEEAGDKLQVSVADNGIGIPEGEKNYIFDRFFRAQNAVKYQTNGSGLGLYISKMVVEKNGGRIWFESEPGKGTTVYFTVPKAKSKPK